VDIPISVYSYFENPPRFQALHCLRNKVEGGSSYFADAFAAARRLKKAEPKMYDILKDTPVPFHYDNDGKWYHRLHPTIEELPGGALHAINYSPPFQAPLPLLNRPSSLNLAGNATNDLPASLAAFDEILCDKAGQYEFTMQEGDLVFFDNRRILHARRAFKARLGVEDNTVVGEATRWLKGCYLDGDVVWNKLRHLTRDAVNGTFPLDERWRQVIGKSFRPM
jgi:gamma-butyrobetaine dioxygenase